MGGKRLSAHLSAAFFLGFETNGLVFAVLYSVNYIFIIGLNVISYILGRSLVRISTLLFFLINCVSNFSNSNSICRFRAEVFPYYFVVKLLFLFRLQR